MASGVLRWLERGASVLRRLGMGSVVDSAGPLLGKAAARRPVTVNGLRLVGGHVGQLWYLRELEQGRDRFLSEVLRTATQAGGVAVDAGAHIGYFTLELARAVGPGGRVYALEPDPAAAATLRRNVRRNGFSDRVTVVEQAAGPTPGRSTLHLSGGGETSSLAKVAGSHAAIEVDVTQIDDVVAGARVDIVKLDVEGAEVMALDGMRNTLERQRDMTLVAECNPPLLTAMGTSPEVLLERIREEGFSIWQVDDAGSRLSKSIDLDAADYVNLVCARGEPVNAVAAFDRGYGRARPISPPRVVSRKTENRA